MCSVSLRPDGAEEHRQHLLHERCPPGPVQLVRPSVNLPPVPASTSRHLSDIAYVLFGVSPCLLSTHTFNTLHFSSHLLYSLPAWFLLTVKKTTVAMLIWESDGWVKIAAVHHLRRKKWPFVVPCRVLSYKWTPTLSQSLLLLLLLFSFSHHVFFMCLPLLFLSQPAAFFYCLLNCQSFWFILYDWIVGVVT